MYSPPRHKIEAEDYKIFFHFLGNKFIVGGDWNAKHTNWGSSRTARQSNQGLQEACGESALPYRTVTRWVKAFEGRQNVADMRRPGRPSVSEEEAYALTALLDSDRRHTIRELAR